MLTYHIVNDFRADGPQPSEVFTLLDRAIRVYRLILSNQNKALRIRRDGETMDLVRCLPTAPRDPVGEDILVLDFLDRPDWRSDRAVMLAARTLADKLNIRYCQFRGCLLPVPVTDKLPRNLQEKRLWGTVPGDPHTAVRWIDVAGVGRLSPAEFRRRYCVVASSASLAPPQAGELAHSAAPPSPTKPEGRLCGDPIDSAAFSRPLVMRITAFVRKSNGRCKTLKLLPWEFHLMAKTQADTQTQ